MTKREWMRKHHPEAVMGCYGGTALGEFEGGCIGCPVEYGLAITGYCSDMTCEECWTAEMPEGEEET